MRKFLKISLIVVILLFNGVVAVALLLTKFVSVGAREITDSGMVEVDAGNERLTYHDMYWTAPRDEDTRETMAMGPEWRDGWNVYSSLRESGGLWRWESTGAFAERTDTVGVARAELTGRSYSVSIWPLVAIDSLFPVFLLIWVGIKGLKRLRLRRARHPDEFPRCQNCGYDLRGTPRRCPECGTVPKLPMPPVRGDGISAATKNLTSAVKAKRAKNG